MGRQMILILVLLQIVCMASDSLKLTGDLETFIACYLRTQSKPFKGDHNLDSAIRSVQVWSAHGWMSG